MAFNKEKVMDAARKFVDKGQIDKAVKEYLRIVREDPKDVRVWLKIGDLYAKKGSKQEASETYLKVARFYQEQGFYLKAVAVYKQILKLDPRLVEVNLKLAELYRQLGLLSDAMQHFELVAAHFHRDGKTKEALATVRQLVDLDPENVATRIKLAELYSKEAMTVEAVTEFTLVCETLRKQNRQDDFIKVAERLLWHKPENRELNRELASLYLRRNDPRRALQKLQICFKADPRDVETLGLLAQAFQALDQKSKTVSVLKELARVFDENKQRDKAEEVHRKILQFVPVDPESLAYLGDKAKTKLAPAVAAAAAATPQPVVAPPPRPAAKINFTSEVPALTSNMTGAMPLVDEKSLSDEFSLPEYREDEPAADFAADMALEEDSYGRGESSAGEEHADEISKILTETDVYLKYGLHQKAVEHLRRVFALDPENAEAREKLKEVYLAQGREADAVTELMKLAEAMVAIDPDRAEGYLREVLAIDGGHRGALEFARKHRLDLSNSPDVEVIDGGDDELELDPEELGSGQVAAVEDDIDFDDIDFGEASKPSFGAPRGGSRADSFDGIDPAMFGSPPEGARVDLGVRPTRGAPPAEPLDLSRNRGVRLGSEGDAFQPDNTRQIDPARVRALAEMSGAPEPLEFEAGVVEGAGPPPATWARGGLDAAVAAQLDDALADEIDDEVAAELSAARGLPAPREAVPQLDDDLDLPFDPAAARAFDAGVQRGRRDHDASAPTFDPAAAAAFDADRPYPVAPTPKSFGANALAADSFEPDDKFRSTGPALRRAPALGDYVDSGATEFVASPSDLHGAATQDVDLDALPDFGLATAEVSGGTIDQVYDLDAEPDPAQRIADGGALEDDLDEADFYASQGMHSEAVSVLERVRARHPHHPLVAAKLRDALAALGVGDGATGVSDALDAIDAEDAIEAEDSIESSDDADLDAALAADAALEAEEAPDPFDEAVAASGGTASLELEDVEEIDPDELSEPDPDVEEAFAAAPSVAVGRAKRPVVMLEKPVEDSDADTHYDLGLAYKEMGLWDEAIKAFDKVAGVPGRAVQCRLMIGLCHRSAGNPSEAVHQFKIGLHEATVTEREKQSLFYEIGVAYEELGDPREALYYLEMVVKRDPSFLDANDRVQRLRAAAGNARRPRQASDDPDGAIESLLADDT